MLPYTLDGYEVISQQELPAELAHYVGWFLLGNRALSTPEWSKDQCGFATTQFLNNLLAMSYIAWPPGERWENCEAAIINGMDHRAARVDEFIIDFTARQFDADAPWPLIWKET